MQLKCSMSHGWPSRSIPQHAIFDRIRSTTVHIHAIDPPQFQHLLTSSDLIFNSKNSLNNSTYPSHRSTAISAPTNFFISMFLYLHVFVNPMIPPHGSPSPSFSHPLVFLHSMDNLCSPLLRAMLLILLIPFLGWEV